MLTLNQSQLTHCPMCGDEISHHLPLFPCGHLIEIRHDEENQRCIEEVFSHDMPVSEGFCLEHAEAQVIVEHEKNSEYWTIWYFAENKILNTLIKAVGVLSQEKNALSYEIISHKIKWEENSGTITAKIVLDGNGSYWWGTLSMDA